MAERQTLPSNSQNWRSAGRFFAQHRLEESRDRPQASLFRAIVECNETENAMCVESPSQYTRRPYFSGRWNRIQGRWGWGSANHNSMENEEQEHERELNKETAAEGW